MRAAGQFWRNQPNQRANYEARARPEFARFKAAFKEYRQKRELLRRPGNAFICFVRDVWQVIKPSPNSLNRKCQSSLTTVGEVKLWVDLLLSCLFSVTERRSREADSGNWTHCCGHMETDVCRRASTLPITSESSQGSPHSDDHGIVCWTSPIRRLHAPSSRDPWSRSINGADED